MIAAPGVAAEVTATITSPAAVSVPWDVVVVGAGPAGTAAAARIAARGARVLLIDRRRFPRAKVCGCCLSARAIRELVALDASIIEDATPLDAAWIAHRGRSIRIPLPAGRVVSRETLDSRLIRHAISAGCHWLPGANVVGIDDRSDGGDSASVMLQDDVPAAAGLQVISTRTIVLATGLADGVRIGGRGRTNGASGRRIDSRSRIGVGATLPAAACGLSRGELVMVVARGGYCGIVRLEDGRIDVAAALDRSLLAGGTAPAGAVARLLDQAARHATIDLPGAAAILAAPFRATPPLTRHAPLVAGASRRILRIGDAAGYVEPFTGEGIGWALASGRILAESILATGEPRPASDVAARYVAMHRRELAANHARCRLVARGLRLPTVVAAAVAAAGALPWATRRLVPMVIGDTSTGARG